MPSSVQFRVRFFREDSIALGPGKIDMLEAIARTGSISAASREMGMSYKRAWMLIEQTNLAFSAPAVVKSAGGAKGGGATLTTLGRPSPTLPRHGRSSAPFGIGTHPGHQPPHGSMTNPLEIISRPIGFVRSPFQQTVGMPIQTAGSSDVEASLVVLPEFVPGLRDIEGFEYLFLVTHLHLGT